MAESFPVYCGSPVEPGSVVFKGASSHGLFGRGKITTVKVAVNLVGLPPSNAKGLESSNKHAGEIEW